MIPQDKHDDAAVAPLELASDEQILEHAEDLLEWLQDRNWPVFNGVSNRLSSLGPGLVLPITKILEGNDSIWKANIVGHLIPLFDSETQDLYTPLLKELVRRSEENDLIEGVIDFAEIQIGKTDTNIYRESTVSDPIDL